MCVLAILHEEGRQNQRSSSEQPRIQFSITLMKFPQEKFHGRSCALSTVRVNQLMQQLVNFLTASMDVLRGDAINRTTSLFCLLGQALYTL